jgi:hypothetical protein
MSNSKNSSISGILIVVVLILILWGIIGLVEGKGFFGGIGNEFSAIGNLTSLIVKVLIGFGLVAGIVYLLSNKK